MKIIGLLHKIATRCFRKFQSTFGFVTLGARAIVINHEDEVLLVKHTYEKHWYLPGGGVNKGESPKAAVIRELNEEVGVIPEEPPILFGVYYHTYLSAYDYPIIYIVKSFKAVASSSPEIERSGWFHYQNLPDMISPGTKRRLDEYFNQGLQSEYW